MLEVARLKPIQCVFFDVDGIMTDATVQLREDGEWVRRFNVRDGEGIRSLIRAGFHVGVITGAKSGDVIKRIEFVGIPHFYRGITDKLEVFDKHLKEHGILPEHCAYMGDDSFDLPVLKKVGFSVTVPNAIEDVLETAHYTTKRGGGHGAVRELCDLLMKYSDKGNGGS